MEISDLDLHVLVWSVNEDMMLTAEANDSSVKNQTKASLFHSAALLKAAKLLLMDLVELYA